MNKIIVWFRQDFRLLDNPALYDAVNSGAVLPIYIHDTSTPTDLVIGSASKIWLYHTIKSFNQSIEDNLHIYSGNPLTILIDLINQYGINQVNWNRCYNKYQIERDTKIKQALNSLGIKVNSFNGSLLWEPWDVSKADGSQYKVFTPYYRRGCLNAKKPHTPLEKPANINYVQGKSPLRIEQLGLVPSNNWSTSIIKGWDISENGANINLKNFIEFKINSYKLGRDVPSEDSTSKLSPYLSFGQISPHIIWDALNNLEFDDNLDSYRSELGWREFSYYLLYYFPNLYQNNWQKKFDRFLWDEDAKKLKAWENGQTGIPIVDAGMRELWQTGYMHNRVRMIVASFLTKNLLNKWQNGAKWFWDTLFDADIASNSASWQWVAGSGADAQPYFRIFNPISQSEKFDPDGKYIKTYVPEISNLPSKYLFAPWLAPQNILAATNITLGIDYPYPIVDLKLSRQEALDRFKQLTMLNNPKNANSG